MNDFKYSNSALDQRASATVTIDDFAAMIEAAATAIITITDYTSLAAVKASVSFNVEDYQALIGTAHSITIDGNAVVQGTDWTAGTDNDTTAESIKDALDGISGFSATRSGNTVTVETDTAGVAGNSLAITSTAPKDDIGLFQSTLSGGKDVTTVSVDGNDVVEGTDFDAATNEDTTASNLATAIDGITGFSAAAVGAVVTVTHDTAGYAGNAATLTADDETGLSLSGATFSGGQDHATVTLQGTDLVQGTDFTAETDNATTADNLATAMAGESGFTASASGAVVTVYWETPGTAGNAKTLAIGANDQGLSISGATLSGGVAATYTDALEVGGDANVEQTLDVTSLGGSTPTLDVTPQYSYEKTVWYDQPSAYQFTQASGATTETLDLNTNGAYVRYKIVLGGTNPVADLTIRAIPK